MEFRLEPVAITFATLYVLLLGWAMAFLSYNVWGAFVVAPVIVVITVPAVRSIFSGEHSDLFPIAVAGLIAKLGGSILRYAITFQSYGGLADAPIYHDFARQLAGAIRNGTASPFDAVPRAIGTQFINQLTALIYTLFGSSQLAGFFIYAWMGYWGALLFVRAALVAVPGLAKKRYAALVFFSPTLLYWPSSIGKEAWIVMCLGLASYGCAMLLVGRWNWWSFGITVLGITGAGFARPHFAAIWTGALVVALVVGLFTGSAGTALKSRFTVAFFVVIAIIGLSVVAAITTKFLKPPSNDATATDDSTSNNITAIFNEANRRTEGGNSKFDTITIRGPQDWPYAIWRTLTRPMLYEAHNLAALLPALEMTGLLLLALFSWRRVANLPRLLAKTSYLVFALVVLMMFGLAFSVIGNLGILTRQRSLVMPLFLLLWCVPQLPDRSAPRPTALTTRDLAVARNADG